MARRARRIVIGRNSVRDPRQCRWRAVAIGAPWRLACRGDWRAVAIGAPWRLARGTAVISAAPHPRASVTLFW
jgi:hypothetical protein